MAIGLPWGLGHAADGFHVRYSLYGGAGAGIFSQPGKPGWTGGVSYSYSDITALSGPDGGIMTTSTAADAVAPGITYPANPVKVHATGFSSVATLGVSYGLESPVGGGRLVLGLSTGYGRKSQQIRASANTPVLSPLQGALVTAGFNAQYQAGIAALAAAETAAEEGPTDSDINLNWHHPMGEGRLTYGLSLIVPTGKYSTSAGPHVGFGSYYTLRPSVQAVVFSSPSWGHAAKLTLGLSTVNRDTHVRSGHWAAVEMASSYMTRLGPVGLQLLRVQQFRDDSGGSWGANRLVMTNAGVFWATKLPVLDAGLSLNGMTTLNSRNAKAGRYYQLRLSKSF
ncbi:MAG: hypothetical protein RLZZ271_28 [Pseudomonadota bacterium]